MPSFAKPRLAPIVSAYEYFKVYPSGHCVKYQLALRRDGQFTERRHSDRPTSETRSSSGWTRPSRSDPGVTLLSWVASMERLGFRPSTGVEPGEIPVDDAKEENYDRWHARKRREEAAK